MFQLNDWTVTKILRIDSLGALLSAASLGLGLANFESIFGMPQAVIWPLAYVALGFCLFASMGSLLSVKAQRRVLSVMIVNNSVYSLITLILLDLHWGTLSILGLFYFIGEIAIVAALIRFELAVLLRSRSSLV